MVQAWYSVQSRVIGLGLLVAPVNTELPPFIGAARMGQWGQGWGRGTKGREDGGKGDRGRDGDRGDGGEDAGSNGEGRMGVEVGLYTDCRMMA